jgi:hypothetical protein
MEASFLPSLLTINHIILANKKILARLQHNATFLMFVFTDRAAIRAGQYHFLIQIPGAGRRA